MNAVLKTLIIILSFFMLAMCMIMLALVIGNFFVGLVLLAVYLTSAITWGDKLWRELSS